jgi:excinuclease UvrABC ATPase subunit
MGTYNSLCDVCIRQKQLIRGCYSRMLPIGICMQCTRAGYRYTFEPQRVKQNKQHSTQKEMNQQSTSNISWLGSSPSGTS